MTLEPFTLYSHLEILNLLADNKAFFGRQDSGDVKVFIQQDGGAEQSYSAEQWDTLIKYAGSMGHRVLQSPAMRLAMMSAAPSSFVGVDVGGKDWTVVTVQTPGGAPIELREEGKHMGSYWERLYQDSPEAAQRLTELLNNASRRALTPQEERLFNGPSESSFRSEYMGHFPPVRLDDPEEQQRVYERQLRLERSGTMATIRRENAIHRVPTKKVVDDTPDEERLKPKRVVEV